MDQTSDMGAGTGADIAARLAALPVTSGTWWRITLLSLGGFFEFYDVFVGTYIAPGLVKAHILTTTTPGLFGTTGVAGFVAAFFAGLFVGTFCFAFVADRLGRRAIFTWSLVWYAVASFIMAFQTDAFGLNLWRFLCGVGVGVELVTIDTYIAELCPAPLRGRAFAFSNIIQFLAVPLAALLGWLLVPHYFWGLDGWRLVVITGALGALAAWWIRRGLPESPRWLVQKGRLAEAERIVAAWEDEARRETPVWRAPVLAAAPAPVAEKKGTLREIFAPPYRRRTVMLVVFNLFQAAGYYGFAAWVPTLLVSQGIAVTTSLLYAFVIAVAAPVGPLLGFWFTGHLERKHLIVAAALAIAGFGLLFTQARGMAAIIFCGVGLTLANNILSFAYHGYQPELYPTRIRAFAVGFVYSFSRLSTIFSSFVIAAILRLAGAPGGFVFIAGCMGVVALVIGLLGPRTKGKSLESLSA